MKRKLSLLLVMVMMLSMVLPVFAADDGSITILNPEPGVNYEVYKIFDATYTGDGNAAYTIEESSPWTTVAGFSGLFTLNNVVGKSEIKSVEVIGTEADIRTWLQSVEVPQTVSPEVVLTEDESSKTVPFGYYIIKDNKTDDVQNRVVTVDNVNGNIEILDKNQTPSWDDPFDPEDDDHEKLNPESGTGKLVSSLEEGPYGKTSTQQMGEHVFFKIGAFVPMYNGTNKVHTYTFTDTVPDGLTVDEDDIGVELFNNSGNSITLAPTDYTKNVDSTTGHITVTLDADEMGDRYPTHGKLVISYKALVNGDADYANINTVDMTWTEFDPNDDDSTPEEPNTGQPNPSDTTTFVYGFDLGKYAGIWDDTEGEDGGYVADQTNILEAKFKLYDAATGDNEIKLVVAEPGSGYDYRVAVDGETGVEIEAGQVTIFGLDAKEYYLEETEAPDGYNPLKAREKIDLTEGNLFTGGILDAEVEVINLTGTQLPETGGIGTTIFYIVGGMMMLGAAVLLVAKKRVSAE